MDQNHTSSPEASTDELASPSTPVPGEAGGFSAAPDETPLFTESLVSPSLNETFADTERHARRCRHDGWTPDRIARFLESLAACGVVADACKSVGLSAQSAYAFRNRRAGRAFATAWDAVLIHRARGRLSDELMSRAINGCIEAVHDKHGSITGEKHRYDNRLSMAVLTRLDRLADKQGEREDQLRAISEDFEDLLDVIEASGDVDAFVDARKPPPVPEAAPPSKPAPAPPLPHTHRVEDEWDAMASILGCFHYKATDPAEIDISDLPGPDLGGCEIDQYLRAHYSGYMHWAEAGKADREAAEEAGKTRREIDESPRAYMKALRVRRRQFLEAANAAADPRDPADAALSADKEENQARAEAAEGPEQPSTSSTYRAPGRRRSDDAREKGADGEGTDGQPAAMEGPR